MAQAEKQIIKVIFLCLISSFVVHLKKVEVQVVTDENENTYNIMRKTRCSKLFNRVFSSIVLVFLLGVLIFMVIDQSPTSYDQ